MDLNSCTRSSIIDLNWFLLFGFVCSATGATERSVSSTAVSNESLGTGDDDGDVGSDRVEG